MGDLFYREIGQGAPIIILHGLFGASDNWMSIGKLLGEKNKVYLLDQRNHGNSIKSDAFDYETMAQDVVTFFEEHQIENPIILGHSMGGKVAMNLAVEFPEKISKLIIADIGPKAYPVHHQVILEGLSAINPDTIKNRKEADNILASYVKTAGIRQFLLKNLGRKEDGGFEWKINLPIIREKIENVGTPLDIQSRFEKSTLFIRGGNSNYILDEDFDLIHTIFTDSKIETLEKAGHWLHAEQPQAFINIVNQFLQDS